MKMHPTQQSLPWALRMVIGWQVFVVPALLFVSYGHHFQENGRDDYWIALLMLYPYAAVSLYTAFRLLSDPRSGRRVAIWMPVLFLGFNLLTLVVVYMAFWNAAMIIIFYWLMNLLYAFYTVPAVIILNLPAVKRNCHTASEAMVSAHAETSVISLRRRRHIRAAVLVLVVLVLASIYAGMLSSYFFSTHQAESTAPNRRSRIIVAAYKMGGLENVGIYCWARGKLLPRRIYLTSSSGDTWCYPEAKITWAGNTATIEVIGDGNDVKTFVYTPE